MNLFRYFLLFCFCLFAFSLVGYCFLWALDNQPDPYPLPGVDRAGIIANLNEKGH